MKSSPLMKYLNISIFASFFLFVSGTGLIAQDISFGVFADPVVSWFSSSTKKTENDGSRAGINFGLTFNRYFGKNYSFSTGLSLMHAGGRLTSTDTIEMVFTNFRTKVAPGESMVYRIQYMNIPIGLKFESNQIGYVTFFTDLGLDAKVVVGGKADIPSEDIEKEEAARELNTFNLGYHLMAGIEYSLGGNTSMVFGLGFEHNFLDITSDINNQPSDNINHNIFRFRIGVNF
jgi:hypothetical protein